MTGRKPLSRRSLLAGLALASLSGCVGLLGGSEPTPTPTPAPDRDGDGVPDSDDDYADDFLKAHQINHIEDTIELSSDDFQIYRLSVPSDTHILRYDVLVKGDRGVDVLLMKRDQYLEYENGDEMEYLVSYSQINVGNGIKEKPIDEGEYIIAVDYTNYKTDFGPETVEVNIVIDLARPAS